MTKDKRIVIHHEDGRVFRLRDNDTDPNSWHIGNGVETIHGTFLILSKRQEKSRNRLHLHVGDPENHMDLVILEVEMIHEYGKVEFTDYWHPSEYLEGKKCIIGGNAYYMGKIIKSKTLAEWFNGKVPSFDDYSSGATCII